MIHRITVTGANQELATLYYKTYKYLCARHDTRIGDCAVYVCHNEADHAKFFGIIRTLNLEITEDRDTTPQWRIIEEAILQDKELAQGEPFICKRIIELTGLSDPYRALNLLVEQGFLETSGSRRGHRYKLAGALTPKETP